MFNVFLPFIFAAGRTCTKPKFLGLVPWYQYLDLQKVTPKGGGKAYCDVKDFTILGKNSDIPLVLLAVVDDLLRIAGLVAVIFIIYGGIMYVTSQGSPDQASQAQSTIINALAGLALAIIAVAAVSFLGGRLT